MVVFFPPRENLPCPETDFLHLLPTWQFFALLLQSVVASQPGIGAGKLGPAHFPEIQYRDFALRQMIPWEMYAKHWTFSY